MLLHILLALKPEYKKSPVVNGRFFVYNKLMAIPHRRGFTIIEVSLFLALSGLLMVGLIVGTNASISRQRYNDSVNNFAEYLRTAYNDVSNISNDNPNSSEVSGNEQGKAGRSKYAVYGKLLTFGEPGTTISEAQAYDVVGYAVNSSNIIDSDTLSILRKVQANIVYDKDDTIGSNYQFYRRVTYTAPWGASFEQPNGYRYYGAVLIVRSPVSGIIHTYSRAYTSSNMLNISQDFSPDNAYVYNLFKNLLNDGELSREDVNICIDSEDNNNKRRRNILIYKYAVNSSGVIPTELDANDNPCGSDFAGDPPVTD